MEYGPEPAADTANARVALTSGALALRRSVSAATPSDVAKAANGLADAYTNYLLTAYAGDQEQNKSDYAAMMSATTVLRELCG